MSQGITCKCPRAHESSVKPDLRFRWIHKNSPPIVTISCAAGFAFPVDCTFPFTRRVSEFFLASGFPVGTPIAPFQILQYAKQNDRTQSTTSCSKGRYYWLRAFDFCSSFSLSKSSLRSCWFSITSCESYVSSILTVFDLFYSSIFLLYSVRIAASSCSFIRIYNKPVCTISMRWLMWSYFSRRLCYSSATLR